MNGSERAFLDLLKPGTRAWLSAGSAEPVALAALLTAEPERLDGVELIGSFVPGVNRTDYAALHPGARLTTLLLPPEMRPSFDMRRTTVLPLSYTGLAGHLVTHAPDLAVVQVTPPDARGLCSLGPAADFAPLVWQAARHRIAFINPRLPRPPGGWQLPYDAIDVAIECDHPPLTLAAAEPSAVTMAAADHAAALVPDHAAVQVGIGGVPGAAIGLLAERRDLAIHSGMISDEIAALREAGALRAEGHRTGIAIGSARLYDWLAQAHGFDFVPTPQTHGALALAGVERLVAINSALEVDLFGQANIEWRGGRLASGMGGSPDFMAGARLSPGGMGVIALQSQARDKSRIVTRIDAPTVSLARNTIDVVVTEHGAAHIRDLPLEARAQALIGLAAPEHRDRLQGEWEALRDRI